MGFWDKLMGFWDWLFPPAPSPAPAPSAPKTETLVDPFDVLDRTVWDVYGPPETQSTGQGWPYVEGGKLYETCNPIGSDLVSKRRFDLTGSFISIKIEQVIRQGPNEDNLTGIWIRNTDSFQDQCLSTEVWNNRLVMREWVRGKDMNKMITYDPSAHKYVRMREAGGTVFWETCAGVGLPWVLRHSRRITMKVTSSLQQISVMRWGPNGTDGDISIFDDFNIAPH